MKDILLKGVIALIAILAPIHPILVACGALIILDMITGVIASSKRGDAIKSSELRRTVSKLLVYQIAIISAFIVEKYLLSDLVPGSRVVASIIGMVECKSILENANVIAGKDLFKSFLSKMDSKNKK